MIKSSGGKTFVRDPELEVMQRGFEGPIVPFMGLTQTSKEDHFEPSLEFPLLEHSLPTIGDLIWSAEDCYVSHPTTSSTSRR